MLYWFVVGFSFAITLVLVVGFIGGWLAVEHRISRKTIINRTPDEVWSAITDFKGQTKWRPDLRKVEQLRDVNRCPMWRETDRRGQTLTYQTIDSIPGRRLVRQIADRNISFGGSWTYDIEPYGEVTLLTITEHGEVNNPYFRFISRFIIKQYHTIDHYLEALGRHLGDRVTVMDG